MRPPRPRKPRTGLTRPRPVGYRWLVCLLLGLVLTPGFEWSGRVARLVSELAHGDALRRREVVELLASHPAPDVSDALLSALEDRDLGVRMRAARALGRLGVRDAVPRLIDWLDDPEAKLRAAAARALGGLAAHADLAALRAPRRAGRPSEAPAQPRDEGSAQPRGEPGGAGAPGPSRVVAALIRVLFDGEASVRIAALDGLAEIGGPEVTVPLAGRLDDVDLHVRIAAAAALGRLGDPRAVIPLSGRARDDAPEVRSAVYSALGELSDERAAAALVQGLRDRSPDARLSAVAAVGRLMHAPLARALVGLLEGADARTEQAVVAALGHVPGAVARNALVAALANRRTAALAAQTLVERVRAAHAPDRATPARVRGSEPASEPASARTSGPARALSLVPASAQAPRPEAGAGEGPAVVRALSTALERSQRSGRSDRIARLLRDLSAVTDVSLATSALLRALENRRPGQRAPLLAALAATGAPEALVPLVSRLRRGRLEPAAERERRAVLHALAVYIDRSGADGRVADPLLAVLGDVRPGERSQVVALLGRVGSRRALPTLLSLLDHADAGLRLGAVRAIGAIGAQQGARPLERLLEDPDPRLRFEAAIAIGQSLAGQRVGAVAERPDILAADGTLGRLFERLFSDQPTDRHALLAALSIALATPPGDARRADGSHAHGLGAAASGWAAALVVLARRGDPWLAARALDTLAAWAPGAATRPLVALLREGELNLAVSSIPGLARLPGPEAQGALVDALGAPGLRLRTQAAGALGLRGDVRAARALLGRTPSLPWPASAAAAFSLARLARRGVLQPAWATADLCALARRRDPFVRANVALALGALGVPACPGGPSPRAWLGAQHAEVVRVAAARWAHAARARAGHPGGERAGHPGGERPGTRSRSGEILARCAADRLSPRVAEACRSPEVPTASATADVYAYGDDGRSLLRNRLVALRLADGMVWVGYTDVNGHLRLTDIADGPFSLEDPSATPLER